MKKETLERANKLISVIESINEVLNNNEENTIYFYVNKWVESVAGGSRKSFGCQLTPEFGELLIKRIEEIRDNLQEEFNNL